MTNPFRSDRYETPGTLVIMLVYLGFFFVAWLLAFAYLAGILAAITGGIIFLFKNSVIPWLIGTIGALLCFPLLGIASIVVTGVSRTKSDG